MEIDNNRLFLSFVIGYFDGDATIAKNGTNELNVICYRAWSDYLEKWFFRIWNLAECVIVSKNMVPKAKIKGDAVKLATKNQKFVWFLKCKAKELKIPYLEKMG